MNSLATQERSARTHERLWGLAPWIAGLGVVAFWIALGNRYSLWVDEAFGVEMSQLPLNRLLREIFVTEGNMGPYYAVLWLWEKILPGAQLARGLSVIGTLLAIWGLWTFARRRCDAVTAVGVVFVFAANPFVLSWSIQARGYTLVMALSSWALVAADSFVRTGRRARAIALGVATGLSTAILLSSVFVFVAIFVTVLAVSRSKRTLGELIIAGAATIAVFAPFAYAFANNRSQVGWIPETDWKLFESSMFGFMGGGPTAFVYAVCIVLVVGASVVVRSTRRFIVAFAVVVFSVLGLVAFSLVIQPLFIDRYLAAGSPLLAVAVVGATDPFAGRRKQWTVSVLAAACIAVTSIWSTHVLPPNEDYRGAISIIESEYQPGDGVTVEPTWATRGMLMNWTSLPKDLVLVQEVRGDGVLVLNASSPARGVPSRMWLVVRNTEGIDSVQSPQVFLLRTMYSTELARHELEGIVLYLLEL